MKYYLIAGEASGDLHGADLIKEIKKLDKDALFRFFGGDLMKKSGGTLVKHYREMAFMGILPVILNLRTISRNMKFARKDIIQFNPDVVILIDYPGFNLKMAKFAKNRQIPVFYYIPPKLWAWKEYRVKSIKAYVDQLFTILPFETDFYKKHKVDVNYVGNPLADKIEAFKSDSVNPDLFKKENNLDDRPIVALLSGSRKHEVRKILPEMCKAIKDFPEFQFIVAGVNSIDPTIYSNILKDSNIRIIYDQTYDLLNNSFAAVVTSGTATLETALFQVPQTVLYRVEGGWLMQFIMKKFFLKVKWVSLPNLILNRESVKELIQLNMTQKNIKSELNRLLYNMEYRNKISADYQELKKLIGDAGSAEKAATKMVQLISQTRS